jgi:hypothetical protein
LRDINPLASLVATVRYPGNILVLISAGEITPRSVPSLALNGKT